MQIAKEKRGISQAIATLLLVVVSVAAVGITYWYAVGIMGKAKQFASTMIEVAEVKVGSGGTSLVVYVVNKGTTTVTLDRIIVSYQTGEIVVEHKMGATTVAPSELTAVTVDLPDAIQPGTVYIVTVLTKEGAKATYQVFT